MLWATISPPGRTRGSSSLQVGVVPLLFGVDEQDVDRVLVLRAAVWWASPSVMTTMSSTPPFLKFSRATAIRPGSMSWV